jgi:hypothetical protein
MPVTFNPFNPFSYVNAWSSAVTNADLGRSRVAKGTPVPVEAKSADPGLQVKTRQVGAQTEVTFKGTAKGPAMVQPKDVWGDFYGPQPRSRPVTLSVALNEAPTTDLYGRTNYTEKNARGLVSSPKQGTTGRQVAEQFAREINSKLLAFRAEVVPGATADSAKLIISRR